MVVVVIVMAVGMRLIMGIMSFMFSTVPRLCRSMLPMRRLVLGMVLVLMVVCIFHVGNFSSF